MKRVGVLRGGQGNQNDYETSLKVGGDFISYVMENLSERWKPIDLFIDRDGVWHMSGRPIMPADLPHHVDVVWNTTGANLSPTLENFSIPHISKSAFSSTLENNRQMLREHVSRVGINMPRSIILSSYFEDLDGARNKYAEKKAKEVFEKFSSPWVVKSLTPDSDMTIHVAKTYPNLVEAIEDCVSHGGSILVEELITGKNIQAHSIAKFRGEDVYTLPIKGLSPEEKEKIISFVKDLFNNLGAKHYLNSQFVISPSGKIYLSNIDFSPNQKTDSHFCQSCDAVGAKVHQVIEHMLEQVL